MKETDWAKSVVDMLSNELPNYVVESGKRLIYANEIIEYEDDEPRYNEMAYQTDILINEKTSKNKHIHRVVIETKVNSVTTHDAITYSQKSSTHKYVHPYLRYGIFLGNMEDSSLPGRLFRHGAHFDFMISWKGYSPEEYEMEALIKLIKLEIEASRQLEELIFNTRIKQRNRYFVLHKPLVVEKTK